MAFFKMVRARFFFRAPPRKTGISALGGWFSPRWRAWLRLADLSRTQTVLFSGVSTVARKWHVKMAKSWWCLQPGRVFFSLADIGTCFSDSSSIAQ